MSSFLRTPSARDQQEESSSLDSSPPAPKSSPPRSASSPVPSPHRGFKHNSERMLSSPLKQQRLKQYHSSIQAKREERVLQARGGLDEMLALPLEMAYKEYLAQSNREMDEYESTLSFEDFERQINDLAEAKEKDHEQWESQNKSATTETTTASSSQLLSSSSRHVIKDEADLLDDMLRQEEEEINLLVSTFMDTTLISPSDLEDEDSDGHLDGNAYGDENGSSTSANPDSFASDDFMTSETEPNEN